jgi:hypothetical protein
MVHNGRITICDPQATNRYGIKRSELWATSGTRLHGIQRNVLQTCDLPADQAIVGHKRYQTVWYSTERIINLRPTSEPSNCGPQAVPDCMVHNGTYYKLATHQRTNLYGLKCSKLWAASSTRLYGTQRNVLHISVPSHLLTTRDTRLYGTY